MKRMLINATHTDEIRVAIADGQKLFDLDIDSAGHNRKKGNIYKARITRVEPSLEACFVNYGSERHGFLPYKEISPQYCKKPPKGVARLPINEAVKEGDELIIQVNKEERGNKGAALSTYISLAGRYLVYMPGNQRAGGISRQIRGEERKQLQDKLNRLQIPKNDGVIIRTAGLGRAYEELEWDFNYLKQVWAAIQNAAQKKNAPFFIYQESDLFIRAIRDYLQPDIGEILVDDKNSYEKAREFMQQVMPHNLKKLSYYDDNTPLFSRYQIERQIQSAFEREVKLPSGGSLVIDHTEAMISIDINSAKATKGVDVESTALNTNLEAADEIARQLRLRDLGGLVVIDFIDMRNSQNQRSVENRMRDAVLIDRARVQIGKISRFGLLEMSRQRLRSSINDSSQVTCPTCSGHGFIRSQESLVISIIRLTEEEMIKPHTGKVVIQAPVDIANAILNDKRAELSDLEQRHAVQVAIISNDNLTSPDFHVQRYKRSEANINIADIELVKPEDCNKSLIDNNTPPPPTEQPILDMVVPERQAPKRSLVAKISSWFRNTFKTEKPAQKKRPQNKRKPNPNYKKQHNKQHQGGRNKQQTKQATQGKRNQHNKQQSQHKRNNNNNQNQNQNKNRNNKQKQPARNNKQQQQQKQRQPQKQQQQKQQPQKQQQQKQQPQKHQQQQKQQPQKHQQQQKQQPQKQHQQPKQKAQKQQPVKQQQQKPQEQKKQNNQKPTQAQNHKPQTQAADKDNKKNLMDRPLGSVADLVAKKPPIVPSGAKTSIPTSKQASEQPATKAKDTPVQDKKTNSHDKSAHQDKKPIEQSQSAKQDKPAEHSKPAKQDKPVGQNKPAKQDKSAEQSKPAKQDKPAEQSKPAKQDKPTEQSKPTKQDKPAEQSKPAKQDKPTEQSKPTKQDNPAEQSKPAKQDKPAEQSKPAKQDKPVEQNKPAKQDKPAEQSKPAKQDKPAQENKPSKQDKPAAEAAQEKSQPVKKQQESNSDQDKQVNKT